MKIYEPKREPCNICKDKYSVLLPYCLDGDRIFCFPVCIECRDKIPYQTIPVRRTMDEGFYFCPHLPLTNRPIIENENL